MESNKLKVIMDYRKLSRDLKEKVQLAYATGFGPFMVNFKNSKGQKVIALRFETEEKIYLLRMSEDLAVKLTENDPEDIEFAYSSGNPLGDEEEDTLDTHLFYNENIKEIESLI